MGSRAVVFQDQHRGGVELQQKNGKVEGRSRKALGDIGNLGGVRGVNGAGNVAVKPQEINRPLTRSFCAQLLANAQVAAQINQKQGVKVVDVNGVVGVRKQERGAEINKKPVVEKKLGKKKKVEVIEITETPSVDERLQRKQSSKKKRSETLTSFLTARSKEACGLTKKTQELIVNIDDSSTDNELTVVEYVEDIYKFYKIAEDESRVKDYIDKQPEINQKMRSILVDWLIEVHHKFELRPEVLYLTVNIIDRFLSMTLVLRKELQLVGIGAMLVACKYEEIWAPEVNDFIQISDKAYAREQVLAMEKAILGKLEWYLTVPTPYMFLTRYIKASVPADSDTENMVYFLAELGIMNYSTVIKYPPSMLAAASVYAARVTLNKTPSWTETLKHYTDYTEEQLKECARLLVGFHVDAPENKLRAVYKKYSKADNGLVALRTPAKSLLASTI